VKTLSIKLVSDRPDSVGEMATEVGDEIQRSFPLQHFPDSSKCLPRQHVDIVWPATMTDKTLL